MTKAVYWVCYPCGIRHGRVRTHTSTYHNSECDVCKEKGPVTSGGDFGLYRVPVHHKGYESTP